ncbi:MAG: UDP-N-acetylglucosamine--N-acetylmuramyl-(pentapeptide) pyrophosphoryl-undecaprenol N-acetylglucosamine transferase [Candidatus Dormibacteria bacterium]
MRTLIAGGGTGGHLTPVLALAQELRRADPRGDVVVVGRHGGVAEGLVTAAGIRLETVRVSGLDAGNAVSVLRFTALLPAAMRTARRIIRSFAADVVVGGAGYVSVPVVLAARSLRIPVVLMEQNAVPGRATRLLARRGTLVAAAFAETAAELPRARVVHTGNPIRAGVLATPRRALGGRCDHLLVMGGSQGARQINHAVAGCVEALLGRHPGLRITHQTGALDSEEMDAAAGALPPDVRERWHLHPFIDDVGAAIVAADLVLMRAGGSSLAECAALERPMLLVPYPHAGDHQRFNAAPYVAAGAARLIPDAECDADRVAAEVGALLGDPSTWRRMAATSGHLGRLDAAARIVELLGELTGAAARIPG